MRPSKCSVVELCSLKLTDANLSQVEDGQGIEKTLISIEERKNSINSRKHEVGAVIK